MSRYGNMPFSLFAGSYRSAAVSSAYGERRTMGVTAVERAADDRRTMTLIE